MTARFGSKLSCQLAFAVCCCLLLLRAEEVGAANQSEEEITENVRDERLTQQQLRPWHGSTINVASQKPASKSDEVLTIFRIRHPEFLVAAGSDSGVSSVDNRRRSTTTNYLPQPSERALGSRHLALTGTNQVLNSSHGLLAWDGLRVVTPIGDLNRDGVADFAVSLFANSAGAIGILFGSPIEHPLQFRFISSLNGSGNNEIGHGLTAAGDLNRDGTADIVAGSTNNTLLVLLLRHSGDLLSSTVLDSSRPNMPSPPAGARCGVGLGSLGHLDNDGLPELLVGCDGGGVSICGSYTFFMGLGGIVRKYSANWCDHAALRAALVGTSSAFGFSLAGIGDVDNDGVPDAAYGAPNENAGGTATGAVVIGFMKRNGVLREAVRNAKAPEWELMSTLMAPYTDNMRFGHSISAVGDPYESGHLHVLVGSPAAGSPSGSGRVELLELSSDGRVAAIPLQINADSGPIDASIPLSAGAGLGHSVLCAVEAVPGSHGLTLGFVVRSEPDSRGALVFSHVGNSTAHDGAPWLSEHIQNHLVVQKAVPQAGFARLGGSSTIMASTALGDLNGDGFSEIVVGVNHTASGNKQITIFMSEGENIFNSSLPLAVLGEGSANWPVALQGSFGAALAPAGDANQDGVSDLYIGVPDSGSPLESGSLWLLMLTPAGGIHAALEVTDRAKSNLPAKATGEECGFGLGLLGDSNQDGFIEILLGCRNGQLGHSFAYLLYMGLSGRVAKWVKHDTATHPLNASLTAGSSFGREFASVGDLDGNGQLDYAALAPGAFAICVQFLSQDGRINASSIIFSSDISTIGSFRNGIAQNFATSLTPAGDLNGDGVSDLIVGSSEQGSAGAVLVLFLTASGGVLGGHALEEGSENLDRYVALHRGDGLGKSVLSLGRSLDQRSITVLATHQRTLMDQDPVLLYLTMPNRGSQTDPPVFTLSGAASNSSRMLSAGGVPFGGVVHSKMRTVTPLNPLLGSIGTGDNHFGASVAPIGFMNGDARHDIVVGSPNTATGQGAQAGIFSIIYLQDLAAPWYDASPRLQFGGAYAHCICVHGMLNGDRTNDIIVGAPDYSGGKGVAHFLSINEAGEPAGGQFSRIGDDTRQRYGSACAVIGDVNGDGRSDVVIGVRGTKDAYEGAAHLLFLEHLGTNTGEIRTWGPSNAGQENSAFGSSLAAIGDMDFNGAADVAVGEPLSDYDGRVDSGCIVLLYFGENGVAIKRTVLHSGNSVALASMPTTSGTLLGSSLAPAGDLNNDGTMDLMVGHHHLNESRGGFDILLLGSGTDGIILGAKSFNAELADPSMQHLFQAGGELGRGLSGVGDLDNNGWIDFAVGQPSPSSTKGALYLLQSNFKAHPNHCGGGLELANVVCSLDDRSIKYQTHANLISSNFTIGAANHQTGFSLALLGDVNGDGKLDFAQGVGAAEIGGTIFGVVTIVFMDAAVGIDHTANLYFGEVGAQSPASRVAAIGDLNRDGVPDIAVGEATSSSKRGGIYIVLLTRSGTALRRLFLGNGSMVFGDLSPNQYCGASIAALGDVSADGHMDIIVGCSGDFAQGAEASLVIVSMQPSGLPKAAMTINAPLPGANMPALSGMGYSVATLGDLDGDGSVEVAAGCPSARIPGTEDQAGGLVIFSVQTDLSITDAVFHSSVKLSRFPVVRGGALGRGGLYARGLGFMGDIDGDGTVELQVQLEASFYYGGMDFLSINADRTVTKKRRFDWVIAGLPSFVTRTGHGAIGIGDLGTGRMTYIMGDPHISGVIASVETIETVQAGYCPGELQLTRQCPFTSLKPLVLSAASAGAELFPGRSPLDQLGNSVTMMGDVDDDGFPDYVFGAAGAGAGAVYLKFGRGSLDSSSLGTAQHIVQLLNPYSAADSLFGHAVAAAGDVNADGVPDLFSSLHEHNSGAGAVVFAALKRDGSISFTKLLASDINGVGTIPSIHFHCGFSIASVGDLDGDSVPDVVFGCPSTGGAAGKFGAAVFVRMQRTGDAQGNAILSSVVESSAEFPLFDTGSSTGFGFSVAGLGDVDGNGSPDAAVGSIEGGSGTVTLVFTKGMLLIRAISISKAHSAIGLSATASSFGRAVAAVGDISSPPDGVPDIIVSYEETFTEPTATYNASGALLVLHLASDWTAVKTVQSLGHFTGGLAEHIDPSAPTVFAASIASAGDLDSNGALDLLVGSTNASIHDGLHFVRTSLAMARPSGCGFAPLLTMHTASCAGAASLASIGYENSSVFAEAALLSAVAMNSTGQVQRGALLGSAVMSIGDVDGNSVLDFAVAGGSQPPMVLILLMSEGGAVASTSAFPSAHGVLAGQVADATGFGTAIAPLGHVNGDSVPDLAVGEPLYSDETGISGAVWVLFLSRDGSVGSRQIISNAADTGTLQFAGECGSALAGVGISSSGSPLLAVGCPAVGAGSGGVQILQISPAGTTARHFDCRGDGNSTALACKEEVKVSHWGSAVAALGRVDADAFADIAVGGQGSIRVMFLGADGDVMSCTLLSQSTDGLGVLAAYLTYFGMHLGTAGDVNGDGVGDLLVGHGANSAKDEMWIMHLTASAGVAGLTRYTSHALDDLGLSIADSSDFGVAVTTAGDLSSSGEVSFFVGAPGIFESAGGAYLVTTEFATQRDSCSLQIELMGIPCAASPSPSVTATASPSPLAVPPPNLQSVRLADSGLWLDLNFDQAIQAATSVTCSAYLELTQLAQLGSSPSCVWTSPVVLRIIFGRGASIKAGDTLRMKSGSIIAVVPPFHVFHKADGRVLPPTSPLSPQVQVILPAVAAPCSPAVLDATLSQGSGGRPFIVLWELVGAVGPSGVVLSPSQTATMAAQLATASTAGQLRVVLPPAVLLPGVTYSFALTLQSFLGPSASAGRGAQRLSMTVGAPSAPQLSLQGGAIRSVRRDAELQLAAAGSIGTCAAAAPAVLSYRWRQVGGPSSVRLTPSSDPRRSSVAQGQLLFGRGVYTFEVTVTASSAGVSTASAARVSVSVLEVGLVPAVSGGDRSVGFTVPVELDASSTRDINVAPVQQRQGTTHAMTYSWSCVVIGLPSLQCSSLQPSAPAAKLVLSPASLVPFGGRSLQWTLSVQSAVTNTSTGSVIHQRSGSTVVQLSLSPAPVPLLSTRAPAGSIAVTLPDGRSAWRVQGTGSIILNATAAAPPGVGSGGMLYSWTQLEGDLALPSGRTLQSGAPSQAFSTPLNQAVIAIRPGQLSPGRVYTLQVTAALVSSPSLQGKSTVVLLANSPPTAGAFTVSAADPIIAFATQVRLAAVGWQDDLEDLPLVFSFWAVTSGVTPTPRELQERLVGRPLDSTELSPTLETVLPSPQRTNASGFGNITLIAYAADRQGALAFTTLQLSVRRPVELRPEPVRVFVRQQLNDTQRSISSGDGAGALAQLTGLADLIADSDELNSNNSTALDREVSQNITGSLLQQALSAASLMEFDANAIALASEGAVALTRRPESLDATARASAIQLMNTALGTSLANTSPSDADNSTAGSSTDVVTDTDDAGSLLPTVPPAERPPLSARVTASIVQIGVSLLDSQAGDTASGGTSNAQRRGRALQACSPGDDLFALSVQRLMTAAALGSVQGAAPNQEPVYASSGGPSQLGHAITLNAAALPTDSLSFTTAGGVQVQVPMPGGTNGTGDTAALLITQYASLYCDASVSGDVLRPASYAGIPVTMQSNAAGGLATAQVSVDVASRGRVQSVQQRAAGSGVLLRLPLTGSAPSMTSEVPLVTLSDTWRPAPSFDGAWQVPRDVASLGSVFNFTCPENNTQTNVNHYADGNVSFTVPCPGGPPQTVSCSPSDGGANITFKCAANAMTAGCVFFDEGKLEFSSEGCVLLGVSQDSILCECSHLTSFAGRFSQLATSNQRTVTQGSSRVADIGQQAGQIRSADDFLQVVGDNEPFVVIFVWLLFVLFAALLCITCNLDARQQKEFLRHLNVDEEVLFLKHVYRLSGDDFRLVEHLTASEEAAVVRDPVVAAERLAAPGAASQSKGKGSTSNSEEPLLLNMTCPQSRSWLPGAWSKCADGVLCSVDCCNSRPAEAASGKSSANATTIADTATVGASLKSTGQASVPITTSASPAGTAAQRDSLSSEKLYLRVAQVFRGVSLSGLKVGGNSVEQHMQLHPHFLKQGGNTLSAKRAAIEVETSSQPAIVGGVCSSTRDVGGLVCSAVRLRIRYQHKYWGVCTKFDFTMSRAKRLTLLYLSIMIAMAAAALFYDVRHPEDGDELRFSETVVFALLAAAVQLPLTLVLAQLLHWAARSEFMNTYRDLALEIRNRRSLEDEMKRAQRDALDQYSHDSMTSFSSDVSSADSAQSEPVPLDVDALVHVRRRLRWEVVCCNSGRSSCALTGCCADAPAAAFADPEHPNDSDVDSDDDVQYGWTDAPPGCLRSCGWMLRCCGRHPSQRAVWLRRAREADYEPYGCCWMGGAEEPAPPRDAVASVWQRRQGGRELSTKGSMSAARTQVRMVTRGHELATTRQTTAAHVQGVAGDALTLFLQSVSLRCACRRRYVVGHHSEAGDVERETLSAHWAIAQAAQRRAEEQNETSAVELSGDGSPHHRRRRSSVITAGGSPPAQGDAAVRWSTGGCQRCCPTCMGHMCLRCHCCCVRGTARGHPVSALRGWESVIAWSVVLLVFVGLLGYVLLFGLGRGGTPCGHSC